MEAMDISDVKSHELINLNLPAPPDQEELSQCLPCGSQILSSFDQSLCLPYIRKDHDLIDVLSVCVIKDASNHPRKPPNEMMSTVLNTTKLTNMVMSEMKRYGLAIKAFSSALGMNPATFSLALREPRHWLDSNLVQKRCYYILFLWLNLPQKYRQGTLKSYEDSKHEADLELNPVETMPTIKALVSVLVTELNTHNINLAQFGAKILNENVITVRNMIMTPLPWEIMSWRMKVKYARMWFWLKQRATNRMAMLGMKLKDHPDTAQVAREVLNHLRHCEITSLINEVNKGLPLSVMNSLLYNPVDWSFAHEHEKCIYLSLSEWLGKDSIKISKDDLDINVDNLCKSSLEFVRQNKISITEFAEKICKIPRAHVSLYFNQDIPWHRANSALKAAFTNVMFWMDLEPIKRLEKIKPEVDTSSVSGQSNDTLTAIEEAENIVKMIQNNSDERIDTEVVARLMKVEMRKAGINLKTFAKIVKINRNYFASLLNSPLLWESCTKTQRDVYQSMKVWIDFRQNKTENNQILKPEGIPRKALKPINREVKHSNSMSGKTVSKQTRVRFTEEQRQYMLEYFTTNQRPNHEEKLAMSKHLGLSMRTIMIFFCNRRTRLATKGHF